MSDLGVINSFGWSFLDAKAMNHPSRYTGAAACITVFGGTVTDPEGSRALGAKGDAQI